MLQLLNFRKTVALLPEQDEEQVHSKIFLKKCWSSISLLFVNYFSSIFVLFVQYLSNICLVFVLYLCTICLVFLWFLYSICLLGALKMILKCWSSRKNLAKTFARRNHQLASWCYSEKPWHKSFLQSQTQLGCHRPVLTLFKTETIIVSLFPQSG